MGLPTHRKTLKERVFMLALDGAIHLLIGTIDAVKFARKTRRRIQARRKR